ncbi:serine hydrolase domain-containing protein [Nitrospirillum sp. BR 11163]|uniref:serine hydrolase domain-containing protein n=1 Tax=Nitrospirillum sp. BR 11163 TaxID=3104323 RepID=UPI002AFDD680|nr:serine hydrolase domain-containing protein [Nitrospirillum sp. BR 11163]MEA1674754.1 serine hydrolase domain-containing protein [Nitrospirillum sp. BR 11163]
MGRGTGDGAGLVPAATEEAKAAVDGAALDAIFAALDTTHLPGVAVGVALDGVPLYRKGFGLASLELPVTLSPAIRMRIGSTTKHFGALAYMLLVEEGLAGLDDPVARHVPEMARAAADVTMRQLMNHVGGLRCSLELALQLSGLGRYLSTADCMRLMADDDDVNFQAGEEWCYNNGGYVLLSLAIERLSGMRLGDFFRDHLFRPLGMNDTLLRLVDTDYVPNSASLHMVDGKGDYYRQPLGAEIAAEGGIVSTVDDMLRWLAHLRAGLAGRPTVGSAETWRRMVEPAVLANGYVTGYGLGLMDTPYRGVRTVHHAGGVMGGSSQMITLPDHGLDIIIMANRAGLDPMDLAARIIDACVPGLGPKLEPYQGVIPAGTYYSPHNGGTFGLARHEGRAIISMSGMRLPLVRTPDGLLRPNVAVFHMGLDVPETQEAPKTLRAVEFGVDRELVLLEPDPEADLRAVAGRYAAAASGTTAAVEADGDGKAGRLVFTGRHGTVRHCLVNLAPGLWDAKPLDLAVPIVGGLIAFDNQGFTFNSGRTRRLRFRKVVA